MFIFIKLIFYRLNTALLSFLGLRGLQISLEYRQKKWW